MEIKRPMKPPSEPISDEELEYINYPVVGSPKLDGFRCLVDKVPKTSSMSIWPNLFARGILSNSVFHGLDGELIVGPPNSPDAFHNTNGPLRAVEGSPDFMYYVFDDWIYGDLTYDLRWLKKPKKIHERLIIVEQRILNTYEEVIKFDEEMLNLGYEGSIIRSLKGRYKEGRCSFKEMNVFKRKPFVECEAIILDVLEGLQNLNESKMTKIGTRERSSHKENKIFKGTFGAFKLKSHLWEKEFTASLGKGYTNPMKQEIWNNRYKYIGEEATIKYQKYGSRNAPRFPSVIKIRPKWDLT